MAELSTQCPVVSARFFIVLVFIRRGVLLKVRLFLTREDVRPFVPAKFGSEPFVSFTEFFILLFDFSNAF